VIEELQQCRFVYAMYPFAENLAAFVRTSLPTKLSTYVMAQRPILGHAPDESTLTSFLRNTKVGSLWTTLQLADGRQAIADAAAAKPDESSWRRARDAYFGDENAESMCRAFSQAIAP
jgi:hypothetical protein